MLIWAFVDKTSHIPSYQHVFRDFDEQVKQCALGQFVKHRIKWVCKPKQETEESVIKTGN